MWSYQDEDRLMHSDYKVKRNRRADAIGRIAEPIIMCGSEHDGSAETIVFYEVARVRIVDTIGRIAETIVFCGSERDGRAEPSYFTRRNAVE